MSGPAITRICLIRHGETPWNADRRIQGQIDIELNAHGRRQAHAAGRWLKDEGATALYSSDLLRAWHTAQAVGADCGLTPILAPELRERRYGIFEGLTYDEAKGKHPHEYEQFEHRDPDFAFPGDGESLSALHDRVVARLKDIALAHIGETVLVVTHGGVLDIVNRFVRRVALAPARDFVIPNAGLNWISALAGRWQIDEWAVTAHLDEALDEL
jgi:probable phosphoglycerate mutase